MARPSPLHPIGFRLSPQTQNPYGVTKASPAETYTKSATQDRHCTIYEVCQFLQNAANDVNDAY